MNKDFAKLEYQQKYEIVIKILEKIKPYNEEAKDIYEDITTAESVPEKTLDSIFQDYEDFQELQNSKKIKQGLQKIQQSRNIIADITKKEAIEKEKSDNSLDLSLDEAFIA